MADFANMGLGTDNPFLGQNNPYLQNIIDLSTKDLTDNFNRTAMPAYNAAMVRSGSFGNSGIDEMTRAGQEGLQRNVGDLASKLRFNDYGQQQQEYNWQKQFGEGQRQFDTGTRQWEQNFDRNVFNDAYSQNMGNLQTGLGLLGTAGGFNATDINNATAQQNAPLNYWQQFSNQANAIGQGFGTSQATQGTSSNPLVSGLGGAQLGNSWWNQNQSAPQTYRTGIDSNAWQSANQTSDPINSLGGSQGWWGQQVQG